MFIFFDKETEAQTGLEIYFSHSRLLQLLTPAVCCLPVKLAETPSSLNPCISHSLPQLPLTSVPAPTLSFPRPQLRTRCLSAELFQDPCDWAFCLKSCPWVPIAASVISKHRSDPYSPFSNTVSWHIPNCRVEFQRCTLALRIWFRPVSPSHIPGHPPMHPAH